MPEYTLLAVAYLLAAVAIAVDLGLLRRRATWLTLGVFAGATIVFDVVLTGLPIVTYGTGFTTGLTLGPMPVEDLLYGVALSLTALDTWTWIGRRGRAA